MMEIESRLTAWGKELKDFCDEHPWITFNAPPEDQEEFRKSLEGFEITKHRIALDGLFYKNRLIFNFFKSLDEGVMVMLFVAASKDVFLTIIIRLEEFYKSSDFPDVNGRVEFQRTKTFKREFGQYEDVWLGSVVAATCVKNLSRQMCFVDLKGEIFKTKAIRHGVSVEGYRNLYPKLQVTYLNGSRVFEAGEDGICSSRLYRVDKVSGCVLSGGFAVEPGMKLTSNAIKVIEAKYPSISVETS